MDMTMHVQTMQTAVHTVQSVRIFAIEEIICVGGKNCYLSPHLDAVITSIEVKIQPF